MKIITPVLKWTMRLASVALVLAASYTFIAYWRSTNECQRYNATPGNPMKAVVQCEYGTPDVLQVREIEKPVPGDMEILVRVRAASLNPLDGHLVRGVWALRPMTGLRKPKQTRIGIDYAGVVEAVGRSATNFKVGDEVFGGRSGSFAQYITLKADRALALKPANMSFEQAASAGVAALSALQGLRDYGKVQPGQKVIINGASGGVGTFAVQIAKSLGAEVTGVCSTRNIELVKSLGADHVIDYTKENFTKRGERYDVLFDNVQNHTFSERRRALSDNGICVNVGLGGAGWRSDTLLHMVRALATPVISKMTRQKFVFFVAQFSQTDLNALRELMEAGKVTPVIDRSYKSLSETPQALAYLEEGHARGKVVVTVD